MIEYKKILLPTDFSECSWAAAQTAAELAIQCGGAVTLLHVFSLPPQGPDDGDPWPAAFDGILEGVNESLAAGKAVLESRGLERIDAVAKHGAPPHEILHLAESGDYDLIVLGVRQRRVVERLLHASVAEKVVRAAPCPVLTVHAPAADHAETWPSTADL